MAIKGNLSKILKKATGSLSITEETRKVLNAIPSMVADIEEIKISLLGKSNVGHKHGAEDILSIDGGIFGPAPETVIINCGLFGDAVTGIIDASYFGTEVSEIIDCEFFA